MAPVCESKSVGIRGVRESCQVKVNATNYKEEGWIRAGHALTGRLTFGRGALARQAPDRKYIFHQSCARMTPGPAYKRLQGTLPAYAYA